MSNWNSQKPTDNVWESGQPGVLGEIRDQNAQEQEEHEQQEEHGDQSGEEEERGGDLCKSSCSHTSGWSSLFRSSRSGAIQAYWRITLVFSVNLIFKTDLI